MHTEFVHLSDLLTDHLGDALRLAFVKRKHQAAGTTFRIGEGPAEASIIELEADAD